MIVLSEEKVICAFQKKKPLRMFAYYVMKKIDFLDPPGVFFSTLPKPLRNMRMLPFVTINFSPALYHFFHRTFNAENLLEGKVFSVFFCRLSLNVSWSLINDSKGKYDRRKKIN